MIRRFTLLVVILSGLACNFFKGPFSVPSSKDEQILTVRGVSVSPVAGNGSFTGTVAYTPGAMAGELECRYSNRDTGEWTDQFSKVIPIPADSTLTFMEAKTSFNFTVSKPGNYRLSCWRFADSSGAESADFTVKDAANSPGAPGKFTTARLEIIPGSSPIHATVRVFWGCQPPSGGSLNVLPDGTLEGLCHETETGDNGVWVKDGTLTGKYDSSTAIPNISFTLLTTTKMDGKTSQGETLQYVTDETFIGGGSLESTDPATGATLFTGTATFTFKCDILVGPPICPNVDASGGMSTSFSGEVTFKMTLFP